MAERTERFEALFRAVGPGPINTMPTIERLARDSITALKAKR